MKKSAKAIVSLLLAAITALMLPLTALAATYSGGYGGINYTANVGGSYSSVSTTISVDTSAKLKTKAVVYVKEIVGGQNVEWGTATVERSTIKSALSLNGSFSYTTCESECGIPHNGFFWKCQYYDYINNHAVISGVQENF